MSPTPQTVQQREREHFDRLVAAEGEFNPFADRGWAVLGRRFAEAVKTPVADLLDVGCGTGQSRQIYRSHTQRYVGIDLSEQAIAVARRRFAGDDWHVADAADLPFPADSFDVVAFSSVLHHIPDYQSALREAMRVLRPGGAVFAFDPNLLHPAMMLLRWPASPLYRSEGVSPDERPLLPSQLRQAFLRAGLRRVRQRAQSDLPYRAVAVAGLNTWLRVYNRLDWCWEHSGLGRFLGTFVITTAIKPRSVR